MTAFTARLRRTIDLDTVRGDLAGAVHEAFQPAHVSVWLPGTRPHAAVPAAARAAASQTRSAEPTQRDPAALRRGYGSGWASAAAKES